MGLLIRWVAALAVLVILISHAMWRRAHPLPPDFPELPSIKQLIKESLADNRMICLNTVPFPFDTRQPPQWRPGLPISSKGFVTCQDCDKLTDAGLISKTMDDPANNASVYELTDLGRSSYREEIRNLEDFSDRTKAAMEKAKLNPAIGADTSEPGFCFADKVVLHEVVSALPPVQMGGVRYISIKYVLEAVNPSPFLFDPSFRLLKLPVPQRGPPALYLPLITSLRQPLGAPNAAELDSSVRYGAWLHQ